MGIESEVFWDEQFAQLRHLGVSDLPHSRTTMTTPDWRKLAAIPWSAQTAQVCAALGHTEIPPDGRSRVFQSPLLSLSCDCHEGYFVLHRGDASQVLPTAADVAEATRCRGSGPTNEALRTWLRWWGWQFTPPSP